MKKTIFSLKGKSFCIRQIELVDFTDEYFNLLNQLSITNFEEFDENKNKLFINSLGCKHYICIIEDVDSQKIIGTGTLLIEDKIIHNYGKVGHIEDLVIDKQYRGLELGRLVVEYLTDFSKLDMNCYKCILNCHENLIRFYQKCGYKINGVEMSMYFK